MTPQLAHLEHEAQDAGSQAGQLLGGGVQLWRTAARCRQRATLELAAVQESEREPEEPRAHAVPLTRAAARQSLVVVRYDSHRTPHSFTEFSPELFFDFIRLLLSPPIGRLKVWMKGSET